MDGILLDFTNLDTTTRWWLIIAVALTVFYAVMRPMRKKKDPLTPSRLPPSLASQRAVERDMNDLLVQLSEMARQVTAQLDTRTAKLEMLIQEADQRLAALAAANGQSPAAGGNVRASDPPAVGIGAAAAPPPLDPRHAEVYDLADQKLSSMEISRKLSRPRGEVELILALRDRLPHR